MGTVYKTGDFGFLRGGNLYFAGRDDSQVRKKEKNEDIINKISIANFLFCHLIIPKVKVRGHRVDLSEIERACKETARVEEVYAVCYKPGEVGQKACCKA